MAISSQFTTLLSLLLTIVSLQATAEEQAKIRIMPLGDSITEGCCDGLNPPEGYRGPLYDRLIKNGYYVDFVGSEKDGGADPDHEGHPSFTAALLLECLKGTEYFEFGEGKCQKGNKLEYEPDVFLYHIGTNDLGDPPPDGPPTDPKAVAETVGETLDEIYEVLPGAIVLLAKIILTKEIDDESCRRRAERTKRYNESLQALAQEYFNRGHLIAVVDMETALDYKEDMADCLHPNRNGHKKMADKWFEAIRHNVAVRPSPPGEPKLLGKDGILDQLYRLENLMLPTTGDVDQIWLNHGEGVVTAKATFTEVNIPDSDQKGRIFGYRDVYDELHKSFELNTANSLKEKIDEELGVGFGILPIQERLPAFRWGIDPNFSSRPSDNEGPSEKEDGADRMMAWLIINGPSKGNYVMTWEDFDDFDYNDLVIEVNNVTPLKQTPVFSSPAERDLLGLRGTLDDLCGLENLSRISDSDDQYWENRDTGTATARARYSGDPSETLEYIDRNNERQTIFTEVGDGTDVSSSGPLPSAQVLPVFRWGLESQFSSKPSDNADGADHMVTWEIIGGPCTNGNFLTAWEDRNISASDQDYQDIIVEVSGVEPLPQINDQVMLHRDQIKTEYFPTNEPRSGYIGLFRITATFTNISDSVITKPFFAIVALSGTNRLINADGGHSPRGSTDSVVGQTLSLNIEWAQGTTETVTFDIGLRSRDRFSFFVDLFEGERKR